MPIGSISIHTVNARLEMQTTKPELNMRQQHAQIQIETTQPRLIIDQTECFNSAGRKTNSALAEEIASRGRQNALEYIETTASDGDTLAAFEKGGDPLIDFAERNAYPESDFNVVAMPAVRPKIEAVEGTLKIRSTPEELGPLNGVKFDVRLGSLEVRYIPGSITVDYKV